MLEQKPPLGTLTGRPKALPSALVSFRNREFRWFYVAMLGQMASMNMQLVVPGLLAFELTGSFAALGLMGLFGAVPLLLLSMFGGVLADRMPKRTVLQAGQLLSLLNSAVMSALVFFDLMSMEWIYLAALVQGIIWALMLPASQAIIPDIVGVDRLMNAVSLNFAGLNAMQLLAPVAAGLIISFAGFQWAFLAMASLYGMALASLSRLTWQPANLASERGMTLRQLGVNGIEDIRQGLSYIRGDRLMFLLLSITFLSSIFAMSHLLLLPGYVADVFDGGGSKVGLMFSISATGSLVSMLGLAASPYRRRGILLLASMMVLGVGLLAFAQTSDYWTAAAIMLLIGVGTAMRQALTQGLLQEYTEQAFQGRVMAVFMQQWSILTFGTFVVGIAAEVVGVQPAFMALGIGLMLVTVAVYTFMPSIRRIN